VTDGCREVSGAIVVCVCDQVRLRLVVRLAETHRLRSSIIHLVRWSEVVVRSDADHDGAEVVVDLLEVDVGEAHF